MSKPLVKLLTRPGCEPCQAAKLVLRQLRDENPTLPFDVTVINLLKTPQYKHFNNFVPVLLVNEREVCRFRADSNKLLEAIKLNYK